MLEGKSDDTHVIRELRFVLGDSFFLQATHALGPILFVQLELEFFLVFLVLNEP